MSLWVLVAGCPVWGSSRICLFTVASEILLVSQNPELCHVHDAQFGLFCQTVLSVQTVRQI